MNTALQIKECPNGALIIESPAGTFIVQKISDVYGWKVQAYRPGDVTTAGTFLGHWPTRDAALAVLEIEVTA